MAQTDTPVNPPSNALDAEARCQALLTEGRKLFQAGDVLGASRLYMQAVEINPRNSQGWNDMGVALWQLNEADAAEHSFRTAVEVNPQDVDALVNLSQVNLSQGRLPVAAAYARDALSWKPDESTAISLLSAMNLQGKLAPKALLIQANSENNPDMDIAIDALTRLGVRISQIGEGILEMMAAPGEGPWSATALDRVVNAIQARLLLLPVHSPAAPLLREIAAARNLPVLLVGDEAVAELGSNELQIQPGVSTDASLRLVQSLGKTLIEDGFPTPTYTEGEPLLTLIVGPGQKKARLADVLDRLSMQDIDAGLFEVVAINDDEEGLGDGLTNDILPYAFRVTEVSTNPVEGWNNALAMARGRFLLFMARDTYPENGCVRQHLEAHARLAINAAVLGDFIAPTVRRTRPLAALANHRLMLFPVSGLSAGAFHDWRFFRADNLSIARAALEAIGGFDPHIPAPGADLELGYRLERIAGIKVYFDSRARAVHDPTPNLQNFARQMFELGRARYHMWAKHGDPALTEASMGRVPDAATLISLRQQAEAKLGVMARLLPKLIEAEKKGLPADEGATALANALNQLEPLYREMANFEAMRGMVAAAAGMSTESVMEMKNLARQSTTVLVVHSGQAADLHLTLSSLIRNAGPGVNGVVVNCTTDPQTEALISSSQHLPILEAAGMAEIDATNAALTIANGGTIAIVRAGAVFTPEWRSNLLNHLGTWPDVGVVVPMTNRGTQGQLVSSAPTNTGPVDAYAIGLNRHCAGQHRYTTRIDGHFIMIRRDLVARIGGLSPEMQTLESAIADYALRARAAGYQVRIARDCYIGIGHEGADAVAETLMTRYADLGLEALERQLAAMVPEVVALPEAQTVKVRINRPEVVSQAIDPQQPIWVSEPENTTGADPTTKASVSNAEIPTERASA